MLAQPWSARYHKSMTKNSNPGSQPQKQNRLFGKYLKTMRQKFQESLGETSGAVEIQVEQLDRFERGVEVPSEDILMLLISHFGLQEDEAVELWELAGYEREGRTGEGENDDDRTETLAQHVRQAVPVMLLALDSRILYTNQVDVDVDDNGVVLQFSQAADSAFELQDGKRDTKAADAAKAGRVTISRIGMSQTQAEQLLRELQVAILRKKYLSGPRQLPPTTEQE